MRFGPINLAILAILPIVFSGRLHADLPAIVDPAIVPGANSPEGKKNVAKLASIIIPKVDFERIDIVHVVDFLNIKSMELDPEHVGVPFHLELPSPDAPRFYRYFSLTITDVSVEDLLGYISAQTSLRYKIVKGVVVVSPSGGVDFTPESHSDTGPLIRR